MVAAHEQQAAGEEQGRAPGAELACLQCFRGRQEHGLRNAAFSEGVVGELEQQVYRLSGRFQVGNSDGPLRLLRFRADAWDAALGLPLAHRR